MEATQVVAQPEPIDQTHSCILDGKQTHEMCEDCQMKVREVAAMDLAWLIEE